jgi:CRP-like cAMP-binding protein
MNGSITGRKWASVAERRASAPALMAGECVMDAKAIQSPNRLLASLPLADFDLLRPHLKQIPLVHKTVLFETGGPVDQAYFPHSGIISLVVALAGGQTIETAMIGRDSMVGGASAMNGKISLNKAIVQLPGRASVIDVDRLHKIADANPAFRTTLIRHEQVLFAQAQQTGACNITHAVEERLARWLLRSRDLAGDEELQFTQEFLSQMMGVRRTSVSLIAAKLQEAGLIKYRRGWVKITNLEGLKKASCECYGTIHGHYQRLLGP